MRELLAMLCVLYASLVAAAEGSTPMLARPPLGKRTGFIVNNEGSAGGSSSSSKSPATAVASSATAEPPSFVSVGIRSGCAREKAATVSTLRNKDSASAASRLRGGSTWVFRPPARVSSAEIDAMSRAQAVPNVDPVSSHRTTEGSSSCNRAGRSNHIGGAEFTVSTQRIKDDSSVDASFEDETEGGVASAGGGGGGGGRVGSLPSFPRTLPATSTKAPLNKKFAWVP